MTSSSKFSFLRRVRIHDGECGAVARALHHAVKGLSLYQADPGKVLGSTNERKQMSTKTTLKRIALVAVSALGFGLLSVTGSVAAVGQTPITNDGGAETVTSVLVTTNFAPVAGATGTSVNHTVYFRTSTATPGTSTYNPSVVLASKPSTSTLAEVGSYVGGTGPVALGDWQFQTSLASAPAVKTMAASRSYEAAVAAINGANQFGTQYLRVRYDIAGTYKWTFWNDLNADGIVNGPEFSHTQTVVVAAESAAQALKATVTPYNSTSTTAGTAYGSLVKIVLTDSAGNPANVDASGGIRVSVSNSAKISRVNTTDVTDSANYTLGQNDFNGSGEAWVNVVDATAETISLTLTGVGSAGNFTAPAATNLKFVDTLTASHPTTITVGTDQSTVNTTSEVAFTTAGASVTSRFVVANASDTAFVTVQLYDNSGKVTGLTGAYADLAIGGSSTATYKGAFSITSAFTAATQSYTLDPASAAGVAAGGTAITPTAAAAAADDVELDLTYVRSLTGGKINITGTVTDQFGGAIRNVTVTPSISGRNSTLSLANMVTDASGVVKFSYTDASTSTTSMTDTVTLTTSNSKTASATIVFTTAANLGATTILLTTPSTKAQGATGAGDPTDTINFSEISAGATGVQAGAVDVVAKVTDVNGAVIQGVPVTFTVAGSGVAIRSDKATVYTDNSGLATSKLYAWVAGTYTVTATYGTVSDTAVSSWRQTAESRILSATVNGGVITAKVVDRLGNPVVGAAVSASRTGTGYFGSGASTSNNALTGANGTVDFIFVGEGSVTLNLGADTSVLSYQDSIAAAGKVGTTTVTAYVAGDAETAETGVGSTLTPAGVHSVTVSVAAKSEAATAAEAATDAANLAAEAADAATVAAEEARDAADAATAAVEALASEVATLIAGLRAQITTLANTVAKIAKKVKA